MLYNYQKVFKEIVSFDPHKYPVLEVLLLHLQFINKETNSERLKIHPRSHREWQESEQWRNSNSGDLTSKQ